MMVGTVRVVAAGSVIWSLLGYPFEAGSMLGALAACLTVRLWVSLKDYPSSALAWVIDATVLSLALMFTAGWVALARPSPFFALLAGTGFGALGTGIIAMALDWVEDMLQQPLFVRDGRRLSLTGAGELLLDYARRLLALHDEAVGAVGSGQFAGPIRIGTVQDFADALLGGVLARFVELHPASQVYTCRSCRRTRSVRNAIAWQNLSASRAAARRARCGRADLGTRGRRRSAVADRRNWWSRRAGNPALRWRTIRRP